MKARFTAPMLLLRKDMLPEGPEWEYQLKLDGYRAIAFKSGGTLYLRSRNDKDFSLRYPNVLKGLARLPDETVIDGEVVAFDEQGRPSFNALQKFGSSPAPVVYYVFDVMAVGGVDESFQRADVERTDAASRLLDQTRADWERGGFRLAAGSRRRDDDVTIGGQDRFNRALLDISKVRPPLIPDPTLHLRMQARKGHRLGSIRRALRAWRARRRRGASCAETARSWRCRPSYLRSFCATCMTTTS